MAHNQNKFLDTNVQNSLKIKLILVLIPYSTIFTQDLLGDLNQDGAIDILDIIRTVNIVLEVPPEPTEYEI